MSSFDPGGTERQMIELARRLDRSQFDLHFACFHKRGAWLPHAESASSSIAEFPISGFRKASTVAQARRFSAWLAERGIGVLHTADLYANIFGLPAAAAAGLPARIANRRDINPNKAIGLIALQRAAYSCAHLVVANSRAAATRLRHEQVPESRVRVVPNGIDVSLYPPRQQGRTIRRIVTVANLRREKAHEVLLEATAMVVRRFPDVELLVVGDGPRRSELEVVARRHGVERQTRFLGHRDDVPALLASGDLFVLPSRSEALPNAVLEAMAAGLPVIATRVGGMPEIIDHQRTGVLVAPDDARALGFAMLDLIQWPDHACALGAKARETVARDYSFDRMVAGFEALYLDALRARIPVGPTASELIGS
jgi:glycosyltransferase involved in cell wall biosynthesis